MNELDLLRAELAELRQVIQSADFAGNVIRGKLAGVTVGSEAWYPYPGKKGDYSTPDAEPHHVRVTAIKPSGVLEWQYLADEYYGDGTVADLYPLTADGRALAQHFIDTHRPAAEIPAAEDQKPEKLDKNVENSAEILERARLTEILLTCKTKKALERRLPGADLSICEDILGIPAQETLAAVPRIALIWEAALVRQNTHGSSTDLFASKKLLASSGVLLTEKPSKGHWVRVEKGWYKITSVGKKSALLDHKRGENAGVQKVPLASLVFDSLGHNGIPKFTVRA